LPSKDKQRRKHKKDNRLIAKPREEKKIDNDDGVCCVCFDAEKNWIFIPCGHLACCETCAKNCKNMNYGRGCCPVCRQNIKNLIRVRIC
jgi:hypothetical protein